MFWFTSPIGGVLTAVALAAALAAAGMMLLRTVLAPRPATGGPAPRPDMDAIDRAIEGAEWEREERAILEAEAADRHAWAQFTGVRHAPHPVPVIPLIRPVQPPDDLDRMVADHNREVLDMLVTDPDGRMLAADVEAHVAPGVGSVVSVAAVTYDTATCRTPSERTELLACWDEAHADDEAWGVAHEFAAFDRLTADGLARIDRLQWAGWMWSMYLHDDVAAHCPHCTEAVHEVSGEFAALVADRSATDTGALDSRELAALLAS